MFVVYIQFRFNQRSYFYLLNLATLAIRKYQDRQPGTALLFPSEPSEATTGRGLLQDCTPLLLLPEYTLQRPYRLYDPLLQSGPW